MAVLPRHAEGERGTASVSAVGINHSLGLWYYTRIRATAGNGRRNHFPAISRPFGASLDNRPTVSETVSRGPQNCPLLTKCGARSLQPEQTLGESKGRGTTTPSPGDQLPPPENGTLEKPRKSHSRRVRNDDAGPGGPGPGPAVGSGSDDPPPSPGSGADCTPRSANKPLNREKAVCKNGAHSASILQTP